MICAFSDNQAVKYIIALFSETQAEKSVVALTFGTRGITWRPYGVKIPGSPIGQFKISFDMFKEVRIF